MNREALRLVHVLKAISLFYGSMILLSGLCVALYVLVAEDPFPVPVPSGLDIRTLYMTAALPMNLAIGAALIWAGLKAETRRQVVRRVIRWLSDL